MASLPDIHISRKDEALEAFFNEERVPVRLGKEMALVTGAWGEEFDNARLVSEFVDSFPDEAERARARDMIANTGIAKRHHTWPPLLPRLEHLDIINEQQVRVGATITQESIEANGWDRGDVELLVVVNSAPLVGDFARQVAYEAGLAHAQTRLYSMACNGAIAAVHDIIRTGGVERAVVTAVEGLSPGINLNPGEVDIVSATIFGNGCSSLAFSPVESVTLLAGRTVIVPDETPTQSGKVGVIRMPISLRPAWPEKEEQSPLPEWYVLPDGAEGLFAYGPEKVVMKMPETDTDYIEMEAVAARFFSREVSRVTCDFLNEYYGGELSHRYYPARSPYEHHRDRLTRPETLFVVAHQANEGILILTGKMANRNLRETGPELIVPWILDKVGKGNTSADTILGAWGQFERENQIPKGTPILIMGFGAGGSVTPMLIVVNEA
jgi:3-oxoacyl-[acyl-carrier-protein] synthase III